MEGGLNGDSRVGDKVDVDGPNVVVLSNGEGVEGTIEGAEGAGEQEQVEGM